MTLEEDYVRSFGMSPENSVHEKLDYSVGVARTNGCSSSLDVYPKIA